MIQSVKVKNLSLSNDNVRKSNRDANIDSLAANIAAQGLLQNLIVTPLKKANHFTVKAGGRRLRALQRLIEQGVLPADHEIPVLVLDDAKASIESSLSENFQRVAMNPADECTAFKSFIADGSTADDVARRFGVTTRFVEQRVRLAELAPCVFSALAAGEITLGVAQAYAVTADIDRQAHVFEQMRTSYYGDTPENIRRAILSGSTKASDAKARFVGRDAYLAAGGTIDRDLFASDEDESWNDTHIIEKLAQDKLEAAAAELIAGQGYAFVTPVVSTRVPYDLESGYHAYNPPVRPYTEDEQARVHELAEENDTLVERLESELEYGTPEAEQANNRIDAINRELDEIDEARIAIDPAIRKQVGTFVFIGVDGEARVHNRLFSEVPVVDPNAPVADGSGGGAGGPAGSEPAPENAPRFSATLVDELATQRRQILTAHLGSDPALAIDLAIFLMAQKIVYRFNYMNDGSTLAAPHAQFPIHSFSDEGSQASDAIGEQRAALDQSWAGYPTMSERFDAFRQIGEDARAAWAAFAIAQTLEPTINLAGHQRCNGFHDHIGQLLGIEVASWWRPTAQNFFARVKKDVMLDILDEIGGATLRARYKDAKKGELADACAALCQGQGIIEADARERALAWLPDVMRFEAPDVPDRLAGSLDEDDRDSIADDRQADHGTADDHHHDDHHDDVNDEAVSPGKAADIEVIDQAA